MRKEDQLIHVVYRLPYNLQFFANEGSGGEKTEEATTKKLQDARKEGQVARSNELITAAALATLFIVIKIFVGFIGNRFLETYLKSFHNIEKIAKDGLSVNMASAILSDSLLTIILTCLPLFATAIVVSIGIILLQVKWQISGKMLKPKWNKINPMTGFRKILSKDKFVELLIEVIKITVIVSIAYNTLKDEWKTLLILYDMNLQQAIILIGNQVIDLGFNISMIFLVIGFADLIYQKLKFKKDMRMTKQEVKDEFKNSEGDPQIKSKIRTRMREASQRRMMQSIPKADVVITNPTHLAAAIQYDKESAEAPILLAKGADYVAQKIKEVAKEHNIEIVENKPLARMLYYNVEIGAEIPPELYQMTAEVLAYVYGLKNKN
jgi:flagellar biosynthesis protein FlhB